MHNYVCLNDGDLQNIKAMGAKVIRVIPNFGTIFKTTLKVAKKFNLIEFVHVEETVQYIEVRP